MGTPQGSSADEWAVFLSEHEGPDFRSYVAVQIAEAIERLEKLVYVPGQWRCPKCNFRLTQSNLYAASGTVGPRDEPGDKCPNCNGPLWRVSAMEDRNDAFKCANDTFERVETLSKALHTAIGHIKHMAAWIAAQRGGYSFEGLGEDMPDIETAVTKAASPG